MSLRKTITIDMDLDTNPNKDEKINISFVPDEVILRSVSAVNDDTSNIFFKMWTDLIPGGGFLFAQAMSKANAEDLLVASNKCYESHFNLKLPVQGSYNFKAMYGDGGDIPLNTLGCVVIFQLEFIKH